jgi:ligand-binding sensor domain-containing protein/signal transduction histidine kinase
MVLTQWTGEDGLISNNLTSVGQSADGFIWISSFNGIHLFDGRNFKLYDKENLPVLTTNAIYNMLQMPDGSLLLSTQGSGLIRFLHGKATRVEHLPVSSIRKVVPDAQGRLWCASNSEGVWYMQGDSAVQVKNELLDQVPILDIFPDSQGIVWIATEGNGLIQHLSDGRVYSQIILGRLLAGTVAKVMQLKNGDLLVGTSEGLFVRTKKGAFEVIKGTEEVQINDFIEDPLGYVWVAAEQGLLRVHLSSQVIERFDEEDGLPANQISSILLDHEGSYWLGTKKAGLLRLNSGAIYTLDASDGLLNTRVNIVVENNYRKYVGSDDGSISVIGPSGQKGALVTLAKQKKSGIRDIAFDPDGTIWVASYEGLHRIRDGEERVFTYRDGLTSNFIRRILPTSDGSLWLGTRTGGVLKFRDGVVERKYTIENGLETDFVLAVEQDNEGNIVVGTHSGGLSIISNDHVQTYRLPEMQGMLIFNIHIDAENRYWLSTNVGIFMFYAGTLVKVQFDAPFKTETFFDFLPDKQGNIWLSTNVGVVRADKRQLDEFINGSRTHVKPEIFDHSDGMANRECTGATRATLTASGEVWVPTIDGIATINPSNIQRNTTMPRVAIMEFVVDDEQLIGDRIVVKPGKFRYEISFASSSYLAPQKVTYRYKLGDVDRDWITTSVPKVEYTNLKPGEYTFQVIASNNSNVWNREGATFTFIVQPYLYEAWWFKVLVAIAILFGGYFLFVWRVRHVWAVNRELRKLNEELDRFVYSVSHDLRAPLTSILGLTHIAKATPTAEEKDKCVEMIERSAVKLDGFIGDIIDYSRNQRLDLVMEEINVREELDSILESIRYLDEGRKVECHVSTSVKTMRTDVRRLRVILKNIISNAFNYHDMDKPNPYVHIDCWEEGTKIAISIADNGRGMKDAVIKNIFKMFYRGNADSKGSGLGLYIAKENIQKLEGEIKVASKPGVGTSFTLLIPKG